MTTAAPIDAAQVAQYHADGFLVVRQVCSAERVAELDAEAQRVQARSDLIDTNNIRCRWQNHVETGECRFDCFDPVIDLSDVCERAARDPKLLEIVSALCGEPACLFKDKLIFKPAGALGYQLHQDYISWKPFPTTLLTVIVAIDAADASNGATEVFRGYHQAVYLGPMRQVVDDFGTVLRRVPTPMNIHDWQLLAKSRASSSFLFLEPGDAKEPGCCSEERETPTAGTRAR